MVVFLLILKIIGMSLLTVIGIAVLLLCVPAFIYIEYDSELTIYIRVFFVKLRVLPQDENGFFKKRFTKTKKKQLDKETEQQKKDSEDKSKFKELFGERGVAEAISFLWEILRLVFGKLVRIMRTVVISKLILKVEITGEDSADAALRYGKLCGVIYPLLSLIFQNVGKYKHTEIEVCPNYDRNFEQDKVYLNTTLIIYPMIVVVQIIALLLKLLTSEVGRMFSEKVKS